MKKLTVLLGFVAVVGGCSDSETAVKADAAVGTSTGTGRYDGADTNSNPDSAGDADSDADSDTDSDTDSDSDADSDSDSNTDSDTESDADSDADADSDSDASSDGDSGADTDRDSNSDDDVPTDLDIDMDIDTDTDDSSTLTVREDGTTLVIRPVRPYFRASTRPPFFHRLADSFQAALTREIGETKLFARVAEAHGPATPGGADWVLEAVITDVATGLSVGLCTSTAAALLPQRSNCRHRSGRPHCIGWPMNRRRPVWRTSTAA